MKRSFEQAGQHLRRRPRQQLPAGRYRYVRLRWRTLFAAIDWIGRLLIAVLSPAVSRCRSRRAIQPGEVRSILLVQLDHLGDAVLTASMLPALRQRFPAARIDVLASPWNRDLFAACPDIDLIHVSRRNRFARRARLGWIVSTLWWGWSLRSRRYNLAIDVRGEFPLAALLWLSGARHRLGWDCGGGDFLLTDCAPYVPERPEVESRLALLSRLGIEATSETLSPVPWFDPGDAARRRVECLLAGVGSARQPLAVLHAGAGTQAKRWPASHWQELLGRLILEYGARVVFVGLEAEKHLVRQVTDGLDWPAVADFSGRLNLAETAALIQRASVFVGADSGPAHLAAAVGTPAVVLFSGTNAVRQWRPWGKRVSVVRHPVECSPCHRETCYWSDHPCMTRIAPQAVMRRIAWLLRHDSMIAGSAASRAAVREADLETV